MTSSARLVLVVLLLAAAGVVGVFAFGLLGGGGGEDPVDPVAPVEDGGAPDAPREPAEPRPETTAEPSEPPAMPTPPDVAPKPPAPEAPKIPPLPLSDVDLPDIQWEDFDRVKALYEVAAHAGKNLTFRGGAKALAEKSPVTLKLQGVTAAKAFDLLTQEYDLYWTIRDGAIEIFVDDD